MNNPTMYAVLDDADFVEKIVTVLYGSSAIDARGRKMVRVPTEAFAGGPVGKGWRLRGGYFYSPVDEETRTSAFRVKAPEALGENRDG